MPEPEYAGSTPLQENKKCLKSNRTDGCLEGFKFQGCCDSRGHLIAGIAAADNVFVARAVTEPENGGVQCMSHR